MWFFLCLYAYVKVCIVIALIERKKPIYISFDMQERYKG
jgi:hypothetical protein